MDHSAQFLRQESDRLLQSADLTVPNEWIVEPRHNSVTLGGLWSKKPLGRTAVRPSIHHPERLYFMWAAYDEQQDRSGVLVVYTEGGVLEPVSLGSVSGDPLDDWCSQSHVEIEPDIKDGDVMTAIVMVRRCIMRSDGLLTFDLVTRPDNLVAMLMCLFRVLDLRGGRSQ